MPRPPSSVPGCSLYGFLARDADRGVILRRGPSKAVLLVGWDTEKDTFERGQWFKGRIYERRCDLSPDGELFVYFAAKHTGPFGTWTAVSRPPALTALALWPKGDAWGGGGLFVPNRRGARRRYVLRLNHRANETALADGFGVPPWFDVVPFAVRSGGGEDNPIWEERLARDGWTLTDEGREASRNFDAKVWIVFDPPRVLEKRAPKDAGVRLRLEIHGIKERLGAWWVVEHVLVAGGDAASLGSAEWADWDRRGDLVFASRGRLFRLPRVAAARLDLAAAREIADFRGDAFEAKPPGPARW